MQGPVSQSAREVIALYSMSCQVDTCRQHSLVTDGIPVTGSLFEDWNEHMRVDQASYNAYLAGHGCAQRTQLDNSQ